MTWWRFRSWVAFVLGVGVLAGCASVRPTYPDDPLLIGKRPIVGVVESKQPVRVASVEPPPPPVSPEALAHLPSPPGDVQSAAPPQGKPVQAIPAVRHKEPGAGSHEVD